MKLVAKVAVALLAGFVVLVALFPASGAVAWCYSLIGYPVACGDGNVAAGMVTAGTVGLALWMKDRLSKVPVGLPAGLVVLVLLMPWGGGVDTNPPTCFGMFGWYTVPCGGWPAVAGAFTAGAVELVLWWMHRTMSPAT